MRRHPADPAERARQFAYRVKTAEVVSALQDSNVRPVVLKGLASAQLLYPDDDRQQSTDIDLMVSPHERERARDVLRRIGYEQTFVPRDDPIGRAIHAETWRRPSDSSWVDLHLTLPETQCPPEVSWRVLAGHLVPFELQRVSALALDPPASALLAALHAAHHGPTGPVTEQDLRRALELLKPAEWQEAADLARRLGALEAFGEGLGTLEEGRQLAWELGAVTRLSVRRRLLWASAPWGAVVLDDLARSSPRRWPAVSARLLAPSPRALRDSSSLARRGGVGLALAYAFRPIALARKLPSAVRAWCAARRRAHFDGQS